MGTKALRLDAGGEPMRETTVLVTGPLATSAGGTGGLR